MDRKSSLVEERLPSNVRSSDALEAVSDFASVVTTNDTVAVGSYCGGDLHSFSVPPHAIQFRYDFALCGDHTLILSTISAVSLLDQLSLESLSLSLTPLPAAASPPHCPTEYVLHSVSTVPPLCTLRNATHSSRRLKPIRALLSPFTVRLGVVVLL